MKVGVYDPADQAEWDGFVGKSKQGTFLFYRDYMGYHRDRFVDHSLMVWDDQARLIALLPANEKDDALVSHGGLTYGGLVTDERMKASLMLDVFEQLLAYMGRRGFTKLVYRPVPYIYHRLPAEEDRYALFRHNAVLSRRDVTTVVSSSDRIDLPERRTRSLKKAQNAGVTWGPSDDYAGFWPVLEHNLLSIHGVKPVHTLTEIQQLQASFPENIRLFCSFLEDQIIAGTVIYESFHVAHAQYIANSDVGRSCGALEFMFVHLLGDLYKSKRYFDFGISTEADGRNLNRGLIDFKESLGGRSVVHDFYELELAQPNKG